MPAALQRNLESKLSMLSKYDSDSSGDEDEIKQKKVTIKDKALSEKLKMKSKGSEENTGEASNIIYLGHIPPNFEEREIRSFFSQFGRILKVALSRSRQTTNPRGYAFVKFENKEVASIASETMSGYLMGTRRLVCHVIPKDKVHLNFFSKADRIFTKIDFGKIHRNKVNKPKSIKRMREITRSLINREEKKRAKLKEMGIDYDFPGYKKQYTETSDQSKKRKGKTLAKDLSADTQTPKKVETTTDGEKSIREKSKSSEKKKRKQGDISKNKEAATMEKKSNGGRQMKRKSSDIQEKKADQNLSSGSNTPDNKSIAKKPKSSKKKDKKKNNILNAIKDKSVDKKSTDGKQTSRTINEGKSSPTKDKTAKSPNKSDKKESKSSEKKKGKKRKQTSKC
mmetsp:Transcript_10598/g.11886  ORF Transcript_10598/g.11886 Transcript_10598/m.11886 type:complete len:396 (+) Transcript_10598:68-1255(+)